MLELHDETNPALFTVLDECSVNLTTEIGKVIVKPGSKPIIRTEKTYDKGITVIAAITARRELIFQIKRFDGHMNSEHFKDFLEMLRNDRDPYLRHHVEDDNSESKSSEAIQVVLDNAPFHHSYATRDKAEELGIDLHFQPSHSPEVNAVEELFRQLRDFLKNQLFYDLDELSMTVREFLLNNQVVNIRVARYFS